MELENLETRVMGYIGVDAGIVWIGDPCYIMHKDTPPEELGNNWVEFCENMWQKEEKSDGSYASFNYNFGHEGLGVCTSTKHGDGSYAVIGFFEPGSDRPSCVMVDFDGVFYNEEDEGQKWISEDRLTDKYYEYKSSWDEDGYDAWSVDNKQNHILLENGMDNFDLQRFATIYLKIISLVLKVICITIASHRKPEK